MYPPRENLTIHSFSFDICQAVRRTYFTLMLPDWLQYQGTNIIQWSETARPYLCIIWTSALVQCPFLSAGEQI